MLGSLVNHGNPYHPASFYEGLRGYNKPRMLAETDKPSVRWGDSRYGTVSDSDAHPWVLWSVWGDSLRYNLGTTSPNDWNVSSDYSSGCAGRRWTSGPLPQARSEVPTCLLAG